MRVKASRRRPASKKPKVMKKQRRTKKMLRTKRVRRGGDPLTPEQLLALSKLCATFFITGSLTLAGFNATTPAQRDAIMGIVKYVLDAPHVVMDVADAYGGGAAIKITQDMYGYLRSDEGSGAVQQLVTPVVAATAVTFKDSRPIQATATAVRNITNWGKEKCRQTKEFIQGVAGQVGARLRSVPFIDDCATATEVVHSVLTSAFLIIFTAMNSRVGVTQDKLMAVLRELEEDNALPDGAGSQASSQASSIISLASNLTITSRSDGRDIVVPGVVIGPAAEGAAAEGAAAEGADSQSLGSFPDYDMPESQPPAPPGRDQSPRAARMRRERGGPEGSGSGSERTPRPY